jgi:hypothetical protein
MPFKARHLPGANVEAAALWLLWPVALLPALKHSRVYANLNANIWRAELAACRVRRLISGRLEQRPKSPFAASNPLRNLP